MHAHPDRRSHFVASSLLAWALVSACGAATPATETGDPDPLDRCAGSCASGDRCANGIAWRCECTQHFDVNCGGAERELDPPTWQWSCTPLDPAADRGDGCPFAMPEAGSHCTTEGQRCEYGDDVCGWSGTAATCVRGAWSLGAYDYLPPP